MDAPRARASSPRAAGNGAGSGRIGDGAQARLVNLIGREIIAGGFAPGTRLPDEAAMRERYGMSRTALREAYSKLAAKGLIVARPKIGTHVRPRADWNMLDPEVLSWHLQTLPAEHIAADLYTLRQMVEPSAAALAATTRTKADLDRIAAAFADMKAACAGQGDITDADFRFHREILLATGNPFIGAFSALVHAAMVSTFELSWRGASHTQQARLDQHGAVLEAIRGCQPERARTQMHELLEASIQDVRAALDRRE